MAESKKVTPPKKANSTAKNCPKVKKEQSDDCLPNPYYSNNASAIELAISILETQIRGAEHYLKRNMDLQEYLSGMIHTKEILYIMKEKFENE